MIEYAEMKKILEEQLQLLSEESRKASEPHELCELTHAMVEAATFLQDMGL